MPNPYSTQEQKLNLARRDVSVVERSARFLIVIDEDGCPLCSQVREVYGLNILAIIGPAKIGSVRTQAVLLEVGIWRTRPYHPSRTDPQRRSYAFLTQDMLKNAWPLVEDMLESVAVGVINSWRDVVVGLTTIARRRVNREKVVYHSSKVRRYVRGIHFSISLKDKQLLSTVLNSEIHRRQIDFNEDMRGLKRFIGKNLASYRRIDYSDAQIKHFTCATNGGIATVARLLDPQNEDGHARNLLPHQMFVLLNMLNNKNKRLVLSVLDVLGIDVSLANVWGVLINGSHPILFTKGLVRTIPFRRLFDNGFPKQDFLVFEYIPLSIYRQHVLEFGQERIAS